MSIYKIFSRSAIILSLSTIFLWGIATPASAIPSLPTLPLSEDLYVVSFNTPKQFAGVDVSTGIATVAASTTGFSTLQQSEGAGYEVSTGKTWLLDGLDCSLWLLNNDGTTTQQYVLPTTTGLSDLQACFAMMLNQDGTAYITADVTNTNEDSIIRINLSDGSLVAGSIKDTAEIAGLSKDPTTGDVWASVISNHDLQFPQGLYKINVLTGALDISSQILTSVYNSEDAWDMAFDSSGRLWMMTWGNGYTLASIDPDAPNPAQTFHSVGHVIRSGDNVSLGGEAMWVKSNNPFVSPVPQTVPTNNLANTGMDLTPITASALITMALGLTLRRFSRYFSN